MSINLPSAICPEALRARRTLYWWDGPIVFTANATDGSAWLCLADESGDVDLYVLLPLSGDELTEIEADSPYGHNVVAHRAAARVSDIPQVDIGLVPCGVTPADEPLSEGHFHSVRQTGRMTAHFLRTEWLGVEWHVNPLPVGSRVVLTELPEGCAFPVGAEGVLTEKVSNMREVTMGDGTIIHVHYRGALLVNPNGPTPEVVLPTALPCP